VLVRLLAPAIAPHAPCRHTLCLPGLPARTACQPACLPSNAANATNATTNAATNATAAQVRKHLSKQAAEGGAGRVSPDLDMYMTPLHKKKRPRTDAHP
jgi:hypothetical protein